MSFEVTVTPTVYNVEVEVNPSVQPFDVQVMTNQDLEDLVEEAKQYAEDAEDSADSASASASSASASATTATNQANIATNQALLSSAARLNAQNAANAAEDSADASALSASLALASATSAELDAIATAADRVQTGLDRQATGADRVQTGLDRVATGADRVQTGIDANTASTQAGVATTQAGIATTQAGIATTQAGNALTSANNALNSANAAAASAASAAQVGTSTLLTGFATGANTTILGTDTILQAFQKAQGQINARVAGTGASGQVAFWSGTGSQTGDSGFVWDNTNKNIVLSRSLAGSEYIAFNLQNNSTASTTSVSIKLDTSTVVGATSGAKIQSIRTNSVSTGAADLVFYISRTTTDLREVVRIIPVAGTPLANFGILTNAPTQTLDVNGTGRIRNGVSLADTSGNVQIGTTTDAGFRLDVNGTARVQGALTTNLTATRIPFIGTAGVLSDDAGFTWDNATRLLSLGSNATLQSNALSLLNIQQNSTDSTNGIRLTQAIRVYTTSSIGIIQQNANTNSIILSGGNATNNGGNIQLYGSAGGNFINFRIGSTETLRLFSTSNIGINTTTDAGFRLDVNGTARVQGLVTATLSNYNSTHSGNTTRGFYIVNSADSTVRGGIEYDGTNAFVQLAGRFANGVPFFRQDGANGNISFLRNNVEFGRFFGTGNLLLQNGGTFTDAGFRLDVNGTARVQGDLTLTGGSNILLATTTGTRIGTATNQLLSLWNATPNVQPTTAITAGAFVANTSGIANDTATFDGYTIGQVVAALRRIGALA